MLKKLAPYVKGYTLQTILSPLFIVGEVLLEIYIPLVMKDIINVGIPSGDIDYVIGKGLVMIGLALASLICGVLSGRFASVAGCGFAKNLRQGMFQRIQDFSFANIDKFSTASLITRLTTDVTNVQNMFQQIIRIMFRAPVMCIGALVIAIRLNPRLSTVFAVAMPLMVVGIVIFMKFGHPLMQAMLKKYDGLNASVQENLVAIRVVKAFVRTDYEIDKFNNSADELRKAQLRAERLLVSMMPLVQLIMYGCMISVCWFGGKEIISGEMLEGDLMSFISYVTQILASFMMVGFIFISFVLTKASAGRIVEVLDEIPDIADPENPVTEVPDGSIEFKDVNFGYNKDEEKLVLQNVNLSIKSGETIGIIGGTGSSKSTLVQLIPRLYDVLSGSVSVGGIDVRSYDIETLRNAVAMVLQKNVLFSGTIKENLRWGNENATDEELVNACKTAVADEFVSAFPDGYDTDLSQGGVNLSGGQKQRLCIARALLKNPKVLILDDSTSAVDTATDAKIQAGFKTRFGHVTTIIIAQRIASVENADRTIVLDNGRVADFGTHKELLERSSIYREVYESQKKGVEA